MKAEGLSDGSAAPRSVNMHGAGIQVWLRGKKEWKHRDNHDAALVVLC